MKKILYTLVTVSLLTACEEKTTVVPGAPAEKNTTIVVPGADKTEKTENTTIVNPPATSTETTETKTETKTNP